MKSVLIIDESLPVGVAANTAAVLAMSLGNRVPGLVGSDLRDRSGRVHTGITTLPIPVIGASAQIISAIRRSLCSAEYKEEYIVGFTRTAQSCKTYQEYAKKIADVPFDELQYLGIGLYGRSAKINQLTGGLQLLGQ